MQTATVNNVLIVGGNGAMGRALGARLKRAGYQVQAVDKPLDPDELRAKVGQADLVLLAVPLTAVAEVVYQLGPYLPTKAILADICSIKGPVLRQMLQSFSGPVVGSHPLFGPAPEAGNQLRVVLVQGRGRQALEQVRGVFTRAGLECFEASAQRHDRCMALLQGLNFVTTAAYLACSAQEKGIEEFMTPSFSRRLEAARKMLLEDASLFSSIFEANAHSQDVVRHFRSFLNLAAAGDLDILVEKASWWWRETDPKGRSAS